MDVSAMQASELSAIGLIMNARQKELPVTQIFDYHDSPNENGEKMEFRLIYKGPLPTEGSGTAKKKQSLRKEFHKQLKELWNQHPDLRFQAKTKFHIYTPVEDEPRPPGMPPLGVVTLPEDSPIGKTWLDYIADNFQRCGGRFVPLIRKAAGLTCSLEVLFLRRDSPGGLIASGGDIDNRIKVLFDGLRIPENESQLGGLPLEPDENPFFCLLEDDSLITSVSVTTDRLLLPMENAEKINDVYLVIHVTVVNPSALFVAGRLV